MNNKETCRVERYKSRNDIVQGTWIQVEEALIISIVCRLCTILN